MAPRMRKLGISVLAAAALASCRSDEPIEPAVPSSSDPVLRITVDPRWNGQPMHTFTEYRVPGDYRFQVEMLKFYLSDLRLVGDDGEHAVSTVQLIDLDHGPYTFDLKPPAGRWYGLRAGLGLPHDLNYTDPVLYGNDHPMSVNTGMYWTWATGYKFVLFDGRFNPDPASTGALVNPFSVHTGMDTCYTPVELFPALPFRTRADSIARLTLRIDVDGFLQSGSDTIHVVTENQSHGTNYALALKLTRCVKRSLHAVQP